MPSLQIRDIPEEVYEALAFRARLEHRSLAQQAIVELRRIPELLARERRLEVLHRLKERIASEPPRSLPISPADLIREDRRR
jgi:antitoxin FitA